MLSHVQSTQSLCAARSGVVRGWCCGPGPSRGTSTTTKWSRLPASQSAAVPPAFSSTQPRPYAPRTLLRCYNPDGCRADPFDVPWESLVPRILPRLGGPDSAGRRLPHLGIPLYEAEGGVFSGLHVDVHPPHV